ncbi:uncharacterized protein JCM15063_000314 [Sporobolomyces koalae]|uniref:uncharacterized protein n=1 Tax=Sporobolomyces koalae TaxID=500713 RepID=UPI00317A428E
MSGPPPPIPPRPTEPPALPARPPAPAALPNRPPSFPPVVQGKLIADGLAPKSGVLGKGIKWQASGIVEQGSNLPGQSVAIGDPLTLHMGPESTCTDQKGRQRTEILSWPPSEPGETYLYEWRYHLSPALPTSYKFFHLTQLFSRDQGGFILSLGLVKPGIVKISSTIPDSQDRLCHDSDGIVTDNVMQVDAARYWGRTTCHSMLVTWGPEGAINYTVRDSESHEILLRYSVREVNVAAKGSIKFGLYRAHVCSPASAVIGDISFKK